MNTFLPKTLICIIIILVGSFRTLDAGRSRTARTENGECFGCITFADREVSFYPQGKTYTRFKKRCNEALAQQVWQSISEVLKKAIKRGDKDTLRAFSAHFGGACDDMLKNTSVLHLAAVIGAKKTIKHLTQSDADKSCLLSRDIYGKTPFAVIQDLTENGKNPNLLSIRGLLYRKTLKYVCKQPNAQCGICLDNVAQIAKKDLDVSACCTQVLCKICKNDLRKNGCKQCPYCKKCRFL